MCEDRRQVTEAQSLTPNGRYPISDVMYCIRHSLMLPNPPPQSKVMKKDSLVRCIVGEPGAQQILQDIPSPHYS